MTKIVLDSSSIISLGDSCLLSILKALHERLGIEFIIPKAVEQESIVKPLTIKRFELNALRIQKGLKEGWLKSIKLSQDSKPLVNDILHTFNNLFFIKGQPLRVVQLGEVEALALLKEVKANVFIVDERTIRLLIERPQGMKKLLEKRHKAKVKVRKENLFKLQKMFKGTVIARSSELIALAAKQGIIEEELCTGIKSVEAALFAVKFNGCGISEQEIIDFIKMQKNKY